MNKTSNLTLGNVLLNVLIDIIFFPFWWYSFGLFKTVKKIFNFVADQEKSLAFFVWVKNLFVPMYGQRDMVGRLISFFIRLSQIVFRGIFLLFWILIALLLFWLWVLLPLILAYGIYWQLNAK